MPTELPPSKKPHQDLEIPVGWTSERMLNWLAVVIGIGLCLWAFNMHGVPSSRSDHPGVAPEMSSAGHAL